MPEDAPLVKGKIGLSTIARMAGNIAAGWAQRPTNPQQRADLVRDASELALDIATYLEETITTVRR